MSISSVDFGPLDARHAATDGHLDENLFKKVFIDPAGVDLEDFRSGKKSFIYGIKGSGKSAILKYLDLDLRKNSETRFVYFSDTVRSKPSIESDVEINVSETSNIDSPDAHWRAFFFTLIAKILFESDRDGSKKFLEFIRRQTTGSAGGFLDIILKRAPFIQKWSAELGPVTNMKLEGSFHNIVNIEHFYSSALQLLSLRKNRRKIYIFVDELEVTFNETKRFEQDVELASSLVKIVRDLNEEFRRNKISVFICCGIRREIADRILGGDTARLRTYKPA